MAEERPSVSPNEDLAAAFLALARIKKNEGESFRASAYVKAARALKQHPVRLTSEKEALQIPGIGKGIAQRVGELLKTGKLKELEENKERQEAIDQLTRVPGIGPVAARRLYDEEGVRTVSDLRAMESRLTHQQRIGLKYLEELEQRVPRSEVEEIAAVVRREARAMIPSYYTEVAGSYRRGLPESGDIDILVANRRYEDVKDKDSSAGGLIERLAQRLMEVGLVTDVIASGVVQFMGVAQLPGRPHRHIDLKLFPMKSFPTALLHYTGSGNFNEWMRSQAKSKGFLLNEYGLYPLDSEGRRGEPLPAKSEKDIFQTLGLPYRKPSERSM